MAEKLTACAECGMPVKAGEYHPYAACLMFKACQNSDTVRGNLTDVMERAQHAGEAREPVCRTCNGRGTVNRWERVGESDFNEWEEDCPVCGGAGHAPEHVQKLQDQLIATRQDLHNAQMRIATADLKALIAAPQPAAMPEGFVLVPKEPTPDMRAKAADAYLGSHGYGDAWISAVYAAMLAAAPQPREWDASATTTAGERA